MPFQFTLLGNQLMVTHTNPPTARLTLSGPRRNFTLLDPREIKMFLNLERAHLGDYPVRVNRTEIIYPSGLILDDIEPRLVLLQIAERGETNAAKIETNRIAAPTVPTPPAPHPQ